MLVSGGQGIMRFNVTYRVSQIARVVRSGRVRLCSLFQAPNHTFVLLFLPSLPSPPSLVDLVSIGLVRISTYLVSVTVSGEWLLLAELPWIPACPAQGLLLKACCSRLIARPGTTIHPNRHHPQARLLAMGLNKR